MPQTTGHFSVYPVPGCYRGLKTGVSPASLIIGTLTGIGVAMIGGFLVYGFLKATADIRISEENEFRRTELSICKIAATPDFVKS